MSKKSNRITGQIMLRYLGDPTPDSSERKMAMIVGIIAVPPELEKQLPDEHQFTLFSVNDLMSQLYGLPGDQTIQLQLVTDPAHVTDLHKIGRGNTPDGLLHEPIWRV